MGVVREKEAERARERAERQAVLGTGEGGQGGAATRASHPKQSKGTGRGSMGREERPMGRAAWEIGSSPLPFPLCRWED